MLDHALPSFSQFASLKYSAGGKLVTRNVSQRIGALIAWIASRVGASPSSVTITGCLIFIVGAALYASLPQGIAALLLCVLLYQIGYAFDCADGQLARATGRTSRFGAWLDVACDHVRIVVIHFAVAAWLVAGHDVSVLLAVAVAATGAGTLAVKLHTLTVLATGAYTAPSSDPSWVRRVLTGAMDPPVFMLMLCLLRETPRLLSAYLVIIACMYLTTATLLARKRLGPATADH